MRQQTYREHRRTLVIVAAFLVLQAGGTAAQEASPATPVATAIVLRVEGQVDRPLSLSGLDLARMPRRSLDARDHDGNSAHYEGVVLSDVLKDAGAPLGEKLRGAQLAKFILVEAADAYRAVFALPELDPAFTDRPSSTATTGCPGRRRLPLGTIGNAPEPYSAGAFPSMWSCTPWWWPWRAAPFGGVISCPGFGPSIFFSLRSKSCWRSLAIPATCST